MKNKSDTEVAALELAITVLQDRINALKIEEESEEELDEEEVKRVTG